MACRVATGPLEAIAAATWTAASSSSAGGTTRLTTPWASASSARSTRPASTTSAASERPTVRGSSWVPPAPGSRPRPVSGRPKRAVWEATMMSHIRASSKPPPRQWPLTAATTGLGNSRTQRHDSTNASASAGGGMPSTSAPAAKARSPPASTTAPIASSAARASRWPRRAAMTSAEIALSLSGRFSRSTTIGGAASKSTTSPLTPRPRRRRGRPPRGRTPAARGCPGRC